MTTPIPFSPTRALAIHLPSPGGVHEPSKLQDLTPILSILYSSHLGITDEHLLSAHKAAIVSPPPTTRYGLERQNMAGTHLVILDVEGNQGAEWKEPVLNFPGGATARFPAEKEEGDDGKEEKFVKGGITFSWQIVDGFGHQRALFKFVNGKKVEVARYAQRSSHEQEGLVVLDGREVDDLTVVLTICAMLEAKKSFFKG